MGDDRKGISLHIGLNNVDPNEYKDKSGIGWDGALRWCEKDARDMEHLARLQGFVPSLLLSAAATAENITQRIGQAAGSLTAGDMFWVTFSGHGGSLAEDRDGDEPDERDETWVAFDRQLLDDELYRLFASFASGVRVVVVSDSCFSGGITSEMVPPEDYQPKMLPPDVAEGDLKSRGRLYRSIKERGPSDTELKETLSPQVLHLTACGEAELAWVGAGNSVFTNVLRRVWNQGQFAGDYRDLHDALKRESPTYQTPERKLHGPAEPDLLAERPFTIG